MKRNSFLTVMLTAALTCMPLARGHEGHEQVKQHHELRGKIVTVEPEKNEFTIETDQGRIVLCVIDAKTVLKRDGKTIQLGDVRAGERARCHCAALKEGKHYSQQLLLEKKKGS